MRNFFSSPNIFAAFLVWLLSWALSSCMYDAQGPSQEKLNALRTELVIELKNFSPQKKIFVQYHDSAGTHDLDFSFGLKTSIAGLAVIGIDLAENTYSTSADVWVDEDSDSVKDSGEKKSCSAMSLSKQDPRALCTLTK